MDGLIMDLSIVIPTYNKFERLKIMLKSLYLQRYTDGNFEVIVVDDGTDEFSAMSVKNLQRIYPFRYFYLDKRGRACARNCGIENAQYETILFLDDDVILSPNFISMHGERQKKEPQILHGEIKHFVYSYAFKNPICGLLYEDEERLQRKKNYVDYLAEKCKVLAVPENFDEIYKRSVYMKLEKKIREIFEQNNDAMKWIAFTGGNVSCPKNWLEKVNGFDEEFGTQWGCEDLELGYRLNRDGKPFGYAYDASVCHINHQKKNAAIEHRMSAEYFFNKHKDSSIRDIIEFLACDIKQN